MGALIHDAVVANENRVVRNSAVSKHADPTRCAPTGFSALRNAPDPTAPSNPPGGSAPRTSGNASSAISAGSARNISTVPNNLATGVSIGRLRNQCSASSMNAIGNRNAAYPHNWNAKSAICAPTGPIQFRAGCPASAGPATLNAVSRGEYDSRLSASSAATVAPTKPTNSFNLLFDVGVSARTQFSWVQFGKAPRYKWVARALSREAHREITQKRNHYNKNDSAANKHFHPVCPQVPHA